ncbi:unnamed protein product [Amoebophrya sp. A25]|nr:unnamed protein product [Amoebophrya sp. A25]|eukprot:GSA25T00019719001.1
MMDDHSSASTCHDHASLALFDDREGDVEMQEAAVDVVMNETQSQLRRMNMNISRPMGTGMVAKMDMSMIANPMAVVKPMAVSPVKTISVTFKNLGDEHIAFAKLSPRSTDSGSAPTAVNCNNTSIKTLGRAQEEGSAAGGRASEDDVQMTNQVQDLSSCYNEQGMDADLRDDVEEEIWLTIEEDPPVLQVPKMSTSKGAYAEYTSAAQKERVLRQQQRDQGDTQNLSNKRPRRGPFYAGEEGEATADVSFIRGLEVESGGHRGVNSLGTGHHGVNNNISKNNINSGSSSPRPVIGTTPPAAQASPSPRSSPRLSGKSSSSTSNTKSSKVDVVVSPPIATFATVGDVRKILEEQLRSPNGLCSPHETVVQELINGVARPRREGERVLFEGPVLVSQVVPREMGNPDVDFQDQQNHPNPNMQNNRNPNYVQNRQNNMQNMNYTVAFSNSLWKGRPQFAESSSAFFGDTCGYDHLALVLRQNANSGRFVLNVEVNGGCIFVSSYADRPVEGIAVLAGTLVHPSTDEENEDMNARTGATGEEEGMNAGAGDQHAYEDHVVGQDTSIGRTSTSTNRSSKDIPCSSSSSSTSIGRGGGSSCVSTTSYVSTPGIGNTPRGGARELWLRFVPPARFLHLVFRSVSERDLFRHILDCMEEFPFHLRQPVDEFLRSCFADEIERDFYRRSLQQGDIKALSNKKEEQGASIKIMTGEDNDESNSKLDVVVGGLSLSPVDSNSRTTSSTTHLQATTTIKATLVETTSSERVVEIREDLHEEDNRNQVQQDHEVDHLESFERYEPLRRNWHRLRFATVADCGSVVDENISLSAAYQGMLTPCEITPRSPDESLGDEQEKQLSVYVVIPEERSCRL